jgi:hypothetical protein
MTYNYASQSLLSKTRVNKSGIRERLILGKKALNLLLMTMNDIYSFMKGFYNLAHSTEYKTAPLEREPYELLYKNLTNPLELKTLDYLIKTSETLRDTPEDLKHYLESDEIISSPGGISKNYSENEMKANCRKDKRRGN